MPRISSQRPVCSMPDPFEDLRHALETSSDLDESIEVRADSGRGRRTGAPEVVLADGKSTRQVVAAIEALMPRNGRVIVSRLEPSRFSELEPFLADFEVERSGGASTFVVSIGREAVVTNGGRVAILSAGTSDIPVASEAALVARELGCDVRTVWDVGVAGLHRLVRPLQQLVEWDPDVLIVAAGMDGVLPTVTAGLMTQPVIGLPVSTGYGFGGNGQAALGTMLQTCAPGVVVVNIDNGIGAGVAAALIARRAGEARRASAPLPQAPASD